LSRWVLGEVRRGRRDCSENVPQDRRSGSCSEPTPVGRGAAVGSSRPVRIEAARDELRPLRDGPSAPAIGSVETCVRGRPGGPPSRPSDRPEGVPSELGSRGRTGPTTCPRHFDRTSRWSGRPRSARGGLGPRDGLRRPGVRSLPSRSGRVAAEAVGDPSRGALDRSVARLAEGRDGAPRSASAGCHKVSRSQVSNPACGTPSDGPGGGPVGAIPRSSVDAHAGGSRRGRRRSVAAPLGDR
jgi:hypothetical protein